MAVLIVYIMQGGRGSKGVESDGGGAGALTWDALCLPGYQCPPSQLF